MKTILKLVVALLFPALCFSQAKKKVIFFGDSITEQGAKGGGYILRLDSLLKLKNEPCDLIGAGISGHKIYDLYFRYETDVLNKQPDIVVIYIGINDVWHKRTSGTGTDQNRFEKFYQALISKFQEKKINVILCTPSVIGEKNDFSNEMDGDLNQYSNIVRNLAQRNNCSLIDLRKAFLDYLKENNPLNKDRGILTYDGVHLSAAGNLLVAKTIETVLLASIK